MKLLKNYKKTAMIYDDLKISYKKLIDSVLSYASYLKGAEGKRVAIYTPNRPELSYSIFASWQKEAASITIDATSTLEELIYVFKDAVPNYIFTTTEKKELVAQAISESDIQCKILVFDDLEVTEHPDTDLIEPHEDTEAMIVYTSGTTGDPKGVVLTFRNLYFQVTSLNKFNMFEEKDVYLTLLPLHHVFPLMGSLMIPLINGGTIIFLKELTADNITRALKEYKVTFLCGVPRLYELLYKGVMKKIESSKAAKLIFSLAKHIDNEGIRKKLFKKVQDGFGGHIKYLVSGGAKLDEEIALAFQTFGFKVIEGYGLTETAPMISFTIPSSIKIGSCGTILEGLDVKVNEDGVLCVKGDNVFKGYLNKDELTREVFDNEGYFMTGDLAKIESDNKLYITGRKKEMIVLSNGKNINPVEIEEQVLDLSEGLIEELALVDYNNTLNLVVKPNLKVVEEKKVTNILETVKWDIVDKYNTHAPKYKKILNIKITNMDLPKTKLGKLRRFKVKELLSDENKVRQNIKEPNFTEYKELKKYLFDLCKKNIYPNSHIEVDLGLDSLDMIELLSFVNNKYDLEVNEEVFSKNSTVEKLSLYIKENRGSIEHKASSLLDMTKEYILPKSAKFISFLKGFFYPIFKSYFSIVVKGIDKVEDKASIYIGNHTSMLDAFIVSHALPKKILKNSYFMAKVKHFESKLMVKLADNSNVIIMDINENLKETLNKCAYALRQGKNIVIFPEGVRSRTGEINEFKKFFAVLSEKLDVPVIPFVIKGAYEAMPHGSFIPKPAKIELEFLSKLSKTGVEEMVEEAQRIISEKLKSK